MLLPPGRGGVALGSAPILGSAPLAPLTGGAPLVGVRVCPDISRISEIVVHSLPVEILRFLISFILSKIAGEILHQCK
jgi:hypothetical protein